jgi:hypothetical protein
MLGHDLDATSMFLHNIYQPSRLSFEKQGVNNHPDLTCPLSDFVAYLYLYFNVFRCPFVEAHNTTAPFDCEQTRCSHVTRFSNGWQIG